MRQVLFSKLALSSFLAENFTSRYKGQLGRFTAELSFHLSQFLPIMKFFCTLEKRVYGF